MAQLMMQEPAFAATKLPNLRFQAGQAFDFAIVFVLALLML